ncbi:hypothetical protein [Streptomyces sp. RPT161]|uniref:hypothetical protein n=1 Tax=Streptomyces sp. RPT161 TaxID=3015993 RepID=UPI0022B91439|nr:hypothetical protein [Streptomyces sp. RPT161]
MADFDYPDDLILLQRDFTKASRELSELYAELPPRPTGTDAYTDEDGAHHPATRAWTEEEQARVDGLLARQRDAAQALAIHEFWSTLSGPDVPKARMALEHVDDTAGDE